MCSYPFLAVVEEEEGDKLYPNECGLNYNLRFRKRNSLEFIATHQSTIKSHLKREIC